MAKPTFQHRHYVAIADHIATNMQEWEAKDDIVAQFAMLFAKDNPRFDRERFMAAASGKPINGRDKVR